MAVVLVEVLPIVLVDLRQNHHLLLFLPDRPFTLFR